MCFKIVIDYEIYTFEDPSDLFIAAPFFIDYHGNYFPEKHWSDFVNPILGMWTYNLQEARYLENKMFSLHFMDGPYRLDVFKDDKMELTINAINKDGISDFTVQCNYYDLLKSFNEAMKNFNQILNLKGMEKGKFEEVFNENILSMKELESIIQNR